MAIFKQMALTGAKNPHLSHEKQLELMVPAWHNAFSQETNERAWRKGGFGKDGITMAPLWKQLKREEGQLVDKRALSTAERARNAASELGLNRTFEFDRWLTKPYEQSSHALEKELDVDANNEPDVPGRIEPFCCLLLAACCLLPAAGCLLPAACCCPLR